MLFSSNTLWYSYQNRHLFTATPKTGFYLNRSKFWVISLKGWTPCVLTNLKTDRLSCMLIFFFLFSVNRLITAHTVNLFSPKLLAISISICVILLWMLFTTLCDKSLDLPILVYIQNDVFLCFTENITSSYPSISSICVYMHSERSNR